MSAATPVIEIAHLSKRYRDVAAVDDVSLRVQAGQIYALLGLNGAGKTTLIRMLLGMIAPTAGGVRVLGADVTAGDRTAWAKVGYLVEEAAAYPELTVRENLEVVRRLRRLPGNARSAPCSPTWPTSTAPPCSCPATCWPRSPAWPPASASCTTAA
ncbi:ATP-binding cassette domain-containing protein [Nonomuraea sp. NPDC052129]|uniref:ATP-binding cassette domain-containing protein n=1 Tax=Nonomuraea sp. NPDC052129 TaxID=3154651 RepID=UPI0034221C10